MFTPLDNQTLGHSIAFALLQQPLRPLPPETQEPGAGVYVLYYNGSNPLYDEMVAHNRRERLAMPIYVGKAVPRGVRVGELESNIPNAVTARLRNHAGRIDKSDDLDPRDFFCRYLIMDWVFVPLGESLLIDFFAPVWNKILDGFGNNPPGAGRQKQSVSRWDTCHPGEGWANQLTGDQRHQRDELTDRVRNTIGSALKTWSAIDQKFMVAASNEHFAEPSA